MCVRDEERERGEKRGWMCVLVIVMWWLAGVCLLSFHNCKMVYTRTGGLPAASSPPSSSDRQSKSTAHPTDNSRLIHTDITHTHLAIP